MICVLHNKVKQMKVSLDFLHALVHTRWLLISVNNPLECWAARGLPPSQEGMLVVERRASSL